MGTGTDPPFDQNIHGATLAHTNMTKKWSGMTYNYVYEVPKWYYKYKMSFYPHE